MRSRLIAGLLLGLRAMVVAVGMSVFVGSVRVSRAEAPPSQVDVLLLVDQSGSMGGEPFGMPSSVVPVPNDPAGLRFAAPQAVFNILGIDRLALHRTAEYRFGVISFGGPNVAFQPRSEYAQVTLELSRIAPSTVREWEATQTTVSQSLSPDTWVRQRKNLGSTSFVEPFELACDQFSRQSATSATKRIVIVMTDGIPERPDTTINIEAHLGRVHEVVRNCAALSTAEIHVVALTNFANLRYFDTVEELWWRITGNKSHVGLIANNQQLHQKVAAIIAGVIPWGTRVSRKTAISSHLDRVVFRVFKTATSDVVRFFPPGAKGQDDYIRCGAAIECQGNADLTQIVTVPFPRAGMWRIEVVSGRDVEVWKTEVPVEVSLDTPPSLVQYGKARVGLRLLAQQGAEWSPTRDPDVQISWDGSAMVDGTGATPIKIVPDGDRYAFDLAPTVAGPVRIRLKGVTNGFDEAGEPQPVTVFDRDLALPPVVPGRLIRLRPGARAVDGTDPFQLQEPWAIFGGGERPVRLTIEAVGNDGAVVSPPDLFGGVPPVVATISGPDGDERVELMIGRERWEVTVPMAVAGQYRVSFQSPMGVKAGTALDDAPPMVIDRGDAPWRRWGVPAAYGGSVLVLVGALWGAYGAYTVRRAPRLAGRLKIRVRGDSVDEEFQFRSSLNTQTWRSRRHGGLAIRARRAGSSSMGDPIVLLSVTSIPVAIAKAQKATGLGWFACPRGKTTSHRVELGGQATVPGSQVEISYQR